jgi:hypothetical protein
LENPFDNRVEHDKYLRKNLALSRGYDIERKDKLKQKQAKGEIKPILAKCHRCKLERLCLPFSIMETGHFDGVTSVSKEVVQLCEECSPRKKKHPSEMSKKQIKSLLRGARRGRI